jgi:hypothetical protein
LLKKYFTILIVLWAGVSVYGQVWPYVPSGYSTTLKVLPIPPENGQYRFKLEAAVTFDELDSVQLENIIGGNFGAGYKLFNGQWSVQPDSTYHSIVWSWSPAMAVDYEHGGQDRNDRRKYWWLRYFSVDCVSGDIGANIDSFGWADGFGYWRAGPSINNIPRMAGYILGVVSMEICRWFPLPPENPDPDPKTYIHITDSTYQALPPNSILSGTSPVFVLVRSPGGDSVIAIFNLDSHPTTEKRIKLTQTTGPSGYHYWCGRLANSKDLGLESYDHLNVDMVMYPYDPPDSTIGTSEVDVCLPIVKVDPDPVIIGHDSMKVSEDVDAYSAIIDDCTNGPIYSWEFIDSIGYRYEAFGWRIPILRKVFRQHT